MLPLMRRRPLFVLTVVFLPGKGVVVDFAPAESRWPESEDVDRLVVPLALAAVALSRATDEAFEGLRSLLRRVAQTIATRAMEPPDLVRELTGLELRPPTVATDGTSVVMQLVRSPIGPVPSLGRSSHPASLLGRASVAALGVALARSDAGSRLSAALTIEGLLGWYTQADPQLQPPQQALAYALRHARARLEETNRTGPPALLSAISEHRKINPMAGGGGSPQEGGI